MKIVEYAICWIWPDLSNREKEGFLLISSKPKCRRPCGRKKMSLLWNYLYINQRNQTCQTNTNKNNDNDSEVEEIEHDSW